MKIKKTLEDALADFEAKKMEIAEWKNAHAPALEAAIKEHESFNLRLAELSMADRRKVLDAAGMKHISAAPAPIEHISGAKINPSTKDELKPIDWLHWKHARLALWEACALSLNINPSNMTRHPNDWMDGSESGPIFTDSSFPDMKTQSIFYGRLRLLGENYGNSQYFTDVDNLYAGGANYSAVSPRNFAAWGLDFDFNDMPPELITLAQSRKPEAGLPLVSTPQTAPASKPVTPAAESDVKGVNTAQIVDAFNDLVVIDLGKAMTDKALWTLDARITSGTKGGRYKSLWDPVVMATALHERYKVPMKKLNQAFYTHQFLADWREEWTRLSTM